MMPQAQLEQREVPRKHRVVIAAAVAAIYGKHAFIRQIEVSSGAAAWTRQGRSAVQASHDVSGSEGRK
jgi:hypothetical protein